MAIEHLIESCSELAKSFAVCTAQATTCADALAGFRYGILSNAEIAAEAADIMKGAAVSAVHEGQALQSHASSITAAVDKIIKGNKELEDLAGSSMGGYLDRIGELLAAMKDPKNTYNAAFQTKGEIALSRIESLLRKFDPFFNIDSFRTMFGKVFEDAATNAIVKVATGKAGGAASGKIAPFFGSTKPATNPNQQTIQQQISTGQIRQ